MNWIKRKKVNDGKGLQTLGFIRPIDERIAILEMLLWKYHIKEIPGDVWGRLKENGFVRENNDGSGTWTWTQKTSELGEKFNEIFNY